MERIGESAALLNSTENPINSIRFQTLSMACEEDTSAKFICKLCMKTFYNANALHNHQNTQHDGEVAGTEEDLEDNYPKPGPRNFQTTTNGLCGFKFIPLNETADPDPTTIRDGLTTKTYSQDTTYLLVTVEEDDIDNDAMKKLPTDGIGKKTHVKPKQPIDLRGPFTCTFPSSLLPDIQCRQIFFNCCDYSKHYRQEHTKRRKAALRCQVCERRLDRDFYPSDPITTQPDSPTRITFSCRACGQNFLDSVEFDEHNRLAHAKIKPHQCSICAKRFTQQGGLQQHMRMHTGIRPFVCTYCPKAFTQKAGLDQHLRTHTKVKPFKCVICSKCFSQSVHLRQHMRTHTNIQPFECSICCRRFKQSSHLNFHMRSHVSDGSLRVENFNQGQHDQMDFLNLANFQQVRDGETLYYAAELSGASAVHQNPYN